VITPFRKTGLFDPIEQLEGGTIDVLRADGVFLLTSYGAKYLKEFSRG